jgi:adenylate kinase family enzyme
MSLAYADPDGRITGCARVPAASPQPETHAEGQASPSAVEPADVYRNASEHIKDEFRLLDLRLGRRAAEQRRGRSRGPLDPFKGLVISEEEVTDLLQELVGDGTTPEGDSNQEAWMASLRGLDGRIQARLAASARNGVYLPLPHLGRLFRLTPFETQVLLVCLAPELDPRYGKLYAYLQDDVTRRRPSIELVLSLLADCTGHGLEARAAFHREAPLIRYHLCRIGDDSSIPLPSRPLAIDDRIVQYLLGFRAIDTRLEGLAQLVSPAVTPEPVIVDEVVKGRVLDFVRSCCAPDSNRSVALHLFGPTGSGKRGLAEAVCQDLGIALVTGNLATLSAGPLPFDEAVWRLCREALLQPAALFLEGLDHLTADPERSPGQLDVMFAAMRSLSRLAFLPGRQPWTPGALPEGLSFVSLEVPLPDTRASTALWQAYLAREDALAEDVDGPALAGQFRLGTARIHDAVRAARDRARWRSPAGGPVTMADLGAACRAVSTPRLLSLARRIEPSQSWDDLVLPPDQLAQLREICGHAKYRHVVLGDWGFDRKLALGKGLSALFSGPPGTGKTMAAQVIARELERDLYQIDLSQVVSKFIGETEKNLRHVFDEAEANYAVLFFDEADALFGKRSEVRDAHDRYANMEVSYLLQRMEEYEGIAVLATNFRQNLDEAFVRRLRFIVEFPFPDEEQRRRIWEVTFPPGAPLAEDVDFRTLARAVRLSGGHIRNIGLAAAFRAAADGRVIRLEHLTQAAHGEFRKLGQTWNGVGAGAA